jgi:ribosomal-protein-alanine N-acetyltransferase
MNADPAVMEFFPSMLTRHESDALAERADGRFESSGLGLWAVEVRDGPSFVGFVGLSPFGPEDPSPLPLPPGVEVGWRLSHDVWGQGYAPEAAAASLRYGFVDKGLLEIVSFTSVTNKRSQRVMEKIGLHTDPADNFDHPRVPEASSLRPHVVYRLSRNQWLAAQE